MRPPTAADCFVISYNGNFVDLQLPDAEVRLWPSFVPDQDASDWLERLMREIQWETEVLRIYGREVMSPRMVAWHGDRGAHYAYSGVDHAPVGWTETLMAIRDQLEATVGVRFNSVLANLYRDGRDSMGWHSDDEAELGVDPTIVSISLGAVRRFRLRHRKSRETHGIDLPHGSLLLMAGATQRCWQHAVPKTARTVGPRINLTFRQVGERQVAEALPSSAAETAKTR